MQTSLPRVAAQLALALVLLLSLGSCTSIPQPAEDWVVASRQIHDVVAPRFAAYVQADPALLPADRKTLVDLLDDWDLMIQSGEALYPPAADQETGE